MTETRAQYVTGDPAALVQRLYAKLGRWQRVADACNRGDVEHSAGYYWGVAKRQITRPSTATRRAIAAAATEALASLSVPLKDTRTRVAVKNIVLSPAIWERARDWKNARNLTWDEWAERAQAALEEVSE
jgi:hypothetical protein